jgi:pyruvate formate-lyase/glycerol dehydratase family glycyl radical enzyme
MNERVARLRAQSLETQERISSERAELLTEFYAHNEGRYSVPVMRALAFRHLCANKSIYLGRDELIVGERGPAPKATPTYPEITCHSLEDLRILDAREKTAYQVSPDVMLAYEDHVIPYWAGRTLRERIFEQLPQRWLEAYEAGIFTEFMEQRAPGHTVADGKIYRLGMRDLQTRIEAEIAALDFHGDPQAYERREQLRAFAIAAGALIQLAERHAEEAASQAAAESNPERRAELEHIAEVCRRVPAQAPRTFHEALQMYWFCHVGVILELNGWDSFNPGHLDQHLWPFYQREVEAGTLTRDRAKELLECFWVKFNNQPAPPKVGVTEAESGTYTDFANINLGGMTRDGQDGVNEVSYLLLEVIDEMHTLQPSNNVQLSRLNPDRFLKAALRVVRQGYGFPSIFNADTVVQEMLRQGKSVEDAREGGTSGCVETGAFGKEAYILTGYFNLPKLLELALHNGVDPRSGKQLGPQTGALESLRTFDALFAAWQQQVEHFVDIKVAGNQVIERLYAERVPAPFLSLLIDDCIERGTDYHRGGARYNTSYIQGVGIGTLTDSFSALKTHVYDSSRFTLEELCSALDADFVGRENVRQVVLNQTPRYGNDDDRADALMSRAFETFFHAVDGRPNTRGGTYHIDMLPTTCHVYFGSVIGALPDGRCAARPLSEGISPVQGADRQGPTAVFRSAAKMDHLKTGGTLLNQKFAEHVLADDAGIDKLAHLVRAYFRMNGHHVQFNVVDAKTLRAAQADPEAHRGLIVRVAGYSDYFVDLSQALQDEIIERTEHQTL